jgi:hypothetical protein
LQRGVCQENNNVLIGSYFDSLPTTYHRISIMEQANKKRKSPAASVKKTTTFCWVLLATSEGPQRSTEVTVVGVYGTKETALKQAQIKFEEMAHGFYENGAFIEPEIFEETFDRCPTVGDTGIVLLLRDKEDEVEKVEIQKMPLIE